MALNVLPLRVNRNYCSWRGHYISLVQQGSTFTGPFGQVEVSFLLLSLGEELLQEFWDDTFECDPSSENILIVQMFQYSALRGSRKDVLARKTGGCIPL